MHFSSKKGILKYIKVKPDLDSFSDTAGVVRASIKKQTLFYNENRNAPLIADYRDRDK